MTDTVVWITGASSGLGRALAATVPFDDAHVIDISRSGDTPDAEHLPADLADPAGWSVVASHLLARMSEFAGSRAVFVHNAATLDPIGPAGEVDRVAYRAAVLLNSAAPQVLGNAFLTAVAESGFAGEAWVVQITSGAARSPYAGWSTYSSGKAAVDMWVRTVGLEQRDRSPSVRVVAVAPGIVDTAMQARIREADEEEFPEVERFREYHASGALVAPEDAARGIWALLASDLETGTVTDLRD